jgi:hypothetical protein
MGVLLASALSRIGYFVRKFFNLLCCLVHDQALREEVIRHSESSENAAVGKQKLKVYIQRLTSSWPSQHVFHCSVRMPRDVAEWSAKKSSWRHAPLADEIVDAFESVGLLL